MYIYHFQADNDTSQINSDTPPIDLYGRSVAIHEKCRYPLENGIYLHIFSYMVLEISVSGFSFCKCPHGTGSMLIFGVIV